MANAPAGWYPDPLARSEHRYWDGSRWTDHVMRAGQEAHDPLPAAVATVDGGRDPAPLGRSSDGSPEDDPGDDDATPRPLPGADRRSTVADAPGVTLTDPVPAARPAPDRSPAPDPSAATDLPAAHDPSPRVAPSWPPRLPGQVTERVRPAPRRTESPTPDSRSLPRVSGPGASESRLSVAAVLSLALALLWLGGLGSLAAVVLGVVALRRIRRSAGARTGRRAAIAGTVLGVLGVLATAAGAVLVWTGELPRPPLVPAEWLDAPTAVSADR
jgi:hypothetical protein